MSGFFILTYLTSKACIALVNDKFGVQPKRLLYSSDWLKYPSRCKGGRATDHCFTKELLVYWLYRQSILTTTEQLTTDLSQKAIYYRGWLFCLCCPWRQCSSSSNLPSRPASHPSSHWPASSVPSGCGFALKCNPRAASNMPSSKALCGALASTNASDIRKGVAQVPAATDSRI